MADISTKYAGLRLKSPIIVSSSGLTDSVEKIIELEKNGAGAVVLKSLFEEQILMDIDEQRVNNIYDSYSDTENYISYYTRRHQLEEYLTLIKESKAKTTIPIIASVNCISAAEWTDFAAKIENAGADALELNMFILPSDENMDGSMIESVYFDVIRKVKSIVKIPVSLKISSYFSGMANFAVKLSETGIASLVFFNRFYAPDIDINEKKIISSHIYSNHEENANVLRWVGLLSHKVDCDIASTTGIHTWEGVVKNLMVGAKAVQISSIIYKKGPSIIKEMNSNIEKWMESKSYSTLEDIIGSMSSKEIKKPMMYERAQFMKYFSDSR